MLKDLETLLDRDQSTTEEAVADAARTLLNRQFIYADDHGMAASYALLSRHRSYFTNLFAALGLELVVSEGERMAGVVWQRTPGRWLLRLDETLVLIILRLLREEALTAYRIGDFGEVETTAEEVFARYEERTRRPRPSQARCREILRAFQQRGLVHEGEAIDARNFQLTIRPAIVRAVDQSLLDSLDLYAARAASGASTADDSPMEAAP